MHQYFTARNYLGHINEALFKSNIIHTRALDENAVNELLSFLQPFQCINFNEKSEITIGNTVIPRCAEITLIRKDRCNLPYVKAELPHPLDCKANPNLPDIFSPRNFYKDNKID